MKTVAAQYLEYAPRNATPTKVRHRLAQTFEVVPLSMVVVGWDLPPRLEEAVAEEAARHRATLYRWHPLLASDAGFARPVEWQPVNLHGGPVPGFRSLPEFTFMCPNRSDVQEWIAERIEVAAQRGIYHGLFFDRMRLPSPAENPEGSLACFCKYCLRVASDSGLDLEAVRHHIISLLADADRAEDFTRALFKSTDDALLEAFFRFRLNSITHIVQYAAKLTRVHGLHVGLDCFSPTLTRMVGQDLGALDKNCDWIKLMIYPRVFGPAGLPFELNALSEWLRERYNIDGTEAMQMLGRASDLSQLAGELDSEAIAHEIQLGRNAGVSTLLAGVALVDLEGVHHVASTQVQSDLAACWAADGLVLSWDLWHIPHEYVSLVGEFAAR